MPTLIAFSTTADGQVFSSNATYSTARSGSSLSADTTAVTFIVGQDTPLGQYGCYEAFVGFDTSTIGAFARILSAALAISGSLDHSTTNFTTEARLRDWGATLTTADWVAGASIAAIARQASFASASYSAGYMTFTNDAAISGGVDALTEVIVKTGNTRFILNSDRHRVGNTPANSEYVTYDSADVSGTSSDPKLTVTWALPARNFMLI